MSCGDSHKVTGTEFKLSEDDPSRVCPLVDLSYGKSRRDPKQQTDHGPHPLNDNKIVFKISLAFHCVQVMRDPHFLFLNSAVFFSNFDSPLIADY